MRGWCTTTAYYSTRGTPSYQQHSKQRRQTTLGFTSTTDTPTSTTQLQRDRRTHLNTTLEHTYGTGTQEYAR
eukprot:5400501-Prorocentrum_lima.AAC.1